MDAASERGGGMPTICFHPELFLKGSKVIKERHIPNINTKN
jgi:hypothetical protein